MQVRVTETAARDIDNIIGYLLDHASGTAAANFVNTIDKVFKNISENPDAAQLTDFPGVRRKYVRHFQCAIFYSRDDTGGTVYIRHVRHTRQRPLA